MSEPLLKSMCSTSDRAALSLEVMVTFTTKPLSALTSRSANKESACLSRETSWRIAWHRLWLLTQSRGSSPGGGGTLPRQAGWRGRVGNGILLQTTCDAKLNKSKVSAARAACRHCRGAIGESSRSCRAPRYISTTCILDTRRKVEKHVEQRAGTFPRSDPDTGQHALDGGNLLFETAQLKRRDHRWRQAKHFRLIYLRTKTKWSPGRAIISVEN